jgi:predicted NBD/HSP70 family sugar kinase
VSQLLIPSKVIIESNTTVFSCQSAKSSYYAGGSQTRQTRRGRIVKNQTDTGPGSPASAREALLRSNPQKGSNQVAVRDYNERLILQLIRSHGELTKAEATQATGLSPNAVSVIFRTLEEENLLIRGTPQRGKIGQPSVPARINPDARHYLGLRIGRRGFDLAIVDFAGALRAVQHDFHQYPTPERSIAFVKSALPKVLRRAGLHKSDISGLGIAMPWELWSWTEEFGAPREEMARWKSVDIRSEISRLVPFPVSIANDATAACTGELMHGAHLGQSDFVYFFVGTFVGGGIVLNSGIFFGRRGNAGGFGPLRVPGRPGRDRLVDHASLTVLEEMLRDAGEDPGRVARDSSVWKDCPGPVQAWIEIAAHGLAHAAVSSLALIDFDAVVIDGAFPEHVRRALVAEVNRQLDGMDLQGVLRPDCEAGRLGGMARAIGAATLPMYQDYAINQNTLMRTGPAPTQPPAS